MRRFLFLGRVMRIFIALLILTVPFASVMAHPVQAPQAIGPLTITAIYSNIPGHPTAAVPGLPGVEFDPGTGTTHFDRVFGSPNGNWILTALNNSASTANDEMVLVNNVVRAREGFAFPGSTEVAGAIDTVVNINDAGQFVFATNTDAATTMDDVIVMIDAADVTSTPVREGSAFAGVPGASWAATLDTPSIAADGTVALRGNMTGVPTTQDFVIAYGNTALGQEGVTSPTGTTETWQVFDLSDFFISADGTSWLAQGDLSGDTNTDDVVVVNNTIVVQEGSVLPGTTFPDPVDLNGIVGVFMSPNGDWFVRGNNDVTLDDWVYSNNGLLAAVGQPIFIGATELYDDATFAAGFFLHTGNGNGDYVIGGVTDAADVSANAVLVLNGETVIARENDPIDLDGNGIFDDDTHIHTFGNDDGYLSDAGIFYFVANIRNGAGTVTGQGFFSIDLSVLLNTAPTLQNVAAASPINENEATTLTGNINDPDAGNTFDLVVDWGDGTVMTYSYAAAATFTETHTYLDDDPTATPSDTYSVTLTVIDNVGGTSNGSTTVTVNNVAPTVDAGPDVVQLPNAPVNFTGVFTDVGTLDTHSYTWDFGDGTVVTGTLSTTHTYTTIGFYTATLTIMDDDTGEGSDTLSVTISDPPTDVTLADFSGRTAPSLALILLPLLGLGALFIGWRFRRSVVN
jgi:PKD repeat protein